MHDYKIKARFGVGDLVISAADDAECRRAVLARSTGYSDAEEPHPSIFMVIAILIEIRENVTVSYRCAGPDPAEAPGYFTEPELRIYTAEEN